MKEIRDKQFKALKEQVDIYLKLGRPEAAEKLIRSAMDEPAAHLDNLLGVVYQQQSKFNDAIKHFLAALALNEEFLEARLNLIITYCDLGDYEQASAQHEKLLDSLGEDRTIPKLVRGRLANLHASSGAYYEAIGRNPAAVSEYRKALDLLSEMPDIKVRLAKLYLKAGETQLAMEQVREAVALDPDAADARNLLGLLYYKTGSLEEARKQWLEAKEQANANPVSRIFLRLLNQPPSR